MPAVHDVNRYAVPSRVEQLGADGQRRLGRSRAAIVGVGALGSTIAHQLVRSGVGQVLLIDDDHAEVGNLHRQIMYTEADAAQGRAKVEAAVERLRAANSTVIVEGVEARLDPGNAAELLQGVDIVVDGTDNLASRYVINELCVGARIPWVYGGIAGVHGMMLPIVAGQGPCLRCIFDEPPAEEQPTSQTVGVLGPTAATIGALEAVQAIRILAGKFRPPVRLLSIDTWTGEIDSLDVKRAPDCPTCGGID